MKRLPAFLVLALSILAALPDTPLAAEQTFEEAVAAYERGDYATAIRGFRVHAEQGHVEAQVSLGAMYAIGLGVPQDDAETAKWYRKAAEQGHAKAQSRLDIIIAWEQELSLPSAPALSSAPALAQAQIPAAFPENPRLQAKVDRLVKEYLALARQNSISPAVQTARRMKRRGLAKTLIHDILNEVASSGDQSGSHRHKNKNMREKVHERVVDEHQRRAKRMRQIEKALTAFGIMPYVLLEATSQ